MKLELILTLSLVCTSSACAAHNRDESRPFFQYEYETESHGRKTILDRVVETDPGGFNVAVSPQYLKEPPERIAVLPFTDLGSADFVVDKISLTHRDRTQRLNWAWTDAQRLRRAMEGYLAEREFMVAPLNSVDAVLRARRIDRPEKLDRVSAEELGRLLGVDAVVYGTVLHYEAYYFGLVAGWEVAVAIKIVSTHDEKELVEATGARYDVQILPALDLQDILINSGENLLQLRDIILARAEEEACREIVHRIPESPQLRWRLEETAIQHAEEADPSPTTTPLSGSSLPISLMNPKQPPL